MVVIEKFTKWIEAKPINKLDGKTAVNFMGGIIFKFDIPHSIINVNEQTLLQRISRVSASLWSLWWIFLPSAVTQHLLH